MKTRHTNHECQFFHRQCAISCWMGLLSRGIFQEPSNSMLGQQGSVLTSCKGMIGQRRSWILSTGKPTDKAIVTTTEVSSSLSWSTAGYQWGTKLSGTMGNMTSDALPAMPLMKPMTTFCCANTKVVTSIIRRFFKVSGSG